MDRIEDIFRSLKAQDKTALMPFLTAGYPSLDATSHALEQLGDAGASIVELGFPFSDPIADGPVIAASMYEALQSGVTPDAIFEMVADARSRTELGLVAMVSESIINRIGVEEFIGRAAEVGFDGLIVPDTDVDRADRLFSLATDAGLTLSLLIARSTTTERARQIVERCSGFVYVLARAGITGEQSEAPQIAARVELVRSMTDLPIAVGFGISTAEHVRAVTESADAAIVGSALVRRMGDAADPAAEAVAFVRALVAGLSEVSTGATA